VVARLREPSDRLLGLAGAGAVAVSVALPLFELARVVSGWTASPGQGREAVLATACYLPLHVRHVWFATRGARPPAGRWTLAAMAVVVLGALPVVGTSWLTTLHSLAVSALIVLRPPWSLAAAAALAAAPWPLAAALGDPAWGAFYTVSVLWRGAALFVLVWLVGASRRLQDARLELAAQAIAGERLRIDAELRRTLGVALEAIAVRGERAAALAGGDPARVEAELRALVEGSRRALAQARRTVGGYQRPSPRAELEVAATLLGAAGIPTRVLLPAGDPPAALEAASRAALQGAVARLLRDQAAPGRASIVLGRDGRVELELGGDGAGPATATRVAVPCPS
jgi:two-component system, NarL family, sensor histidine kinase DesK